MALVELTLEELLAERDRRERGEELAEEAERLSGSLREFLVAGWHVIEPKTPYVHSWHVDAICDHVEAALEQEIRKLAVNVPPRTMKSLACSVFAPVWRWTSRPDVRFLTASYVDSLATGFSVKSRDLIRSRWFQARWGDAFSLKTDANLKTHYVNDMGGQRYATSVGGGATGEGADVLIIDDPHNTEESESAVARGKVLNWHDGTLATRFNDPETGVEILIMQRVHEQDLTGHVLELDPGEWTLLCLPEEYEPSHPFVYPEKVFLESGRELRGDPRQEKGELLAPARIGPAAHAERLRRLGSYRAAGQLQQRPSAAEGAILKRAWWRYYDPALLDDERLHLLPRFTSIGLSWDTAFKEKTTSDYVAGGVWGIRGGDRYLLRLLNARMNLTATKTAILEHRAWAIERWPGLPVVTLIEKSANGVEIIEELRRDIPGVKAITASTDKVSRAYAASPDVESGNVFLPGFPSPELDGPDVGRTPATVQELVEQCAKFPAGANDDIVDMVTQLVNWARTSAPVAISTPKQTRRIAKPARLGAGA